MEIQCGRKPQSKNGTRIKPGNIEVSQADGNEVEIFGTEDLLMWISNLETVHKIYISPGLCRELIIGGNRSKMYYAVIHFDPPTLVLGKDKTPLIEIQTKERKVFSKEEMKTPFAVARIGRLDNPNKKEGLFVSSIPITRFGRGKG